MYRLSYIRRDGNSTYKTGLRLSMVAIINGAIIMEAAWIFKVKLFFPIGEHKVKGKKQFFPMPMGQGKFKQKKTSIVVI